MSPRICSTRPTASSCCLRSSRPLSLLVADGRGVMTCRTGENFNGKWSAPSMIALEGGQLWSADWWSGYGLRSSGDERSRRTGNSHQQGETRRRRFSCCRPKGSRSFRRHRRNHARGNPQPLRARGVFAGVSLEGSTLRPDNDGNRICTARNFRRRTSCWRARFRRHLLRNCSSRRSTRSRPNTSLDSAPLVGGRRHRFCFSSQGARSF